MSDDIRDLIYFRNQLAESLGEEDWDGVIKRAKQLKALEDAMVIYSHNSRHDLRE